MKAKIWKLSGKKYEDNKIFRQAARLIKGGGVGILPTDTLYGLVGRAFDRKAVGKIYRLRHREPAKPLIILVSSVRDLLLFEVEATAYAADFLSGAWPGKVSAVLPSASEILSYLHRGTYTLAFRLPDDRHLRALIKETGPLVAPSANLEGCPEAHTIPEAVEYFGDKVDFYIDAGLKDSPPSTLIRFSGKKVEVLREGAVKI